MAQKKVWVSDCGEVFEGTQAQLMRKYGITQKNGFKRPSGAKAEDGTRWALEGHIFKKPKLQIHGRVEYDANGFPMYTSSDLGLEINLMFTGKIKFDSDVWRDLQSQYDVRDNKEWSMRAMYQQGIAEMHTYNWYKAHPKLLPLRAWGRELSDSEYMAGLLSRSRDYGNIPLENIIIAYGANGHKVFASTSHSLAKDLLLNAEKGWYNKAETTAEDLIIKANQLLDTDNVILNL